MKSRCVEFGSCLDGPSDFKRGFVSGGGEPAKVQTNRHRKGKTMSALTRWDPFKEMDDLQKRLSSIFGLTAQRPVNGKEDMTVTQWLPLVDVTEDDKEYLIKAELPDVRKDDVKVVVENGVLTISGERKFEKEEKIKKYHRIERAYGSFTRSFTVPDDADDSKVGAEFKDGMLTVRLAKSEKARPKSIEVKVS
jgi:HSP20 family protein